MQFSRSYTFAENRPSGGVPKVQPVRIFLGQKSAQNCKKADFRVFWSKRSEQVELLAPEKGSKKGAISWKLSVFYTPFRAIFPYFGDAKNDDFGRKPGFRKIDDFAPKKGGKRVEKGSKKGSFFGSLFWPFFTPKKGGKKGSFFDPKFAPKKGGKKGSKKWPKKRSILDPNLTQKRGQIWLKIGESFTRKLVKNNCRTNKFAYEFIMVRARECTRVACITFARARMHE